MSRKTERVQYHLDPRGVGKLSFEEVKAILRGADDLIGSGGRTMLAKILKSSQDKKLLELGLNSSPVYGYYRNLTIEEIQARIDRVILEGYLRIEYDGRLPMLVYTRQGWEIELETYTDELLAEFERMLETGKRPYDMTYLKDRNREMILLLIEKVRQGDDEKYIPLLEDWEAVDYKKVRAELRRVINELSAK